MKRLFPALTAALMASSMAALPLYAQSDGSSLKSAPSVEQQDDKSNMNTPTGGAAAQPEGAGSDAAAEATGAGKGAPDTMNEDAAETAPAQAPQSDSAESESAPNDTTQQDAQSPSSETTASIDLSTEQQTEFRTVFTENRVEPVDIDIDLSVGTAVPNTVTLNPLPPRIIEIVPAYENYQYFVLADGRIVIVEPATLEVIYILTS